MPCFMVLLAIATPVILGITHATELRAQAQSAPNLEISGTWQGTSDARSIFTPLQGFTLVLQQSGAKVTGKASIGGDLEGVVNGNQFSYTTANGGGDLTVKGDAMTGYSRSGAVLNLNRKR